MFSKQRIKIVILFIFLFVILLCGYYMYTRLHYNEETRKTDVYSHVSPQACEVIVVNSESNLSDLYRYNTEFENIIDSLSPDFMYPLLIVSYANESNLLLTKANKYQEENIKKRLQESFSSQLRPKVLHYKDYEILFYPLGGNDFWICTFHRGIFAISKEVQSIKECLDTDPENTFFSAMGNDKAVNDIKESGRAYIMIRDKSDYMRLEYRVYNDTISLGGSICLGERQNSVDSLLPYRMRLPDSLCISKISMDTLNNLPSMKIILNKRF